MKKYVICVNDELRSLTNGKKYELLKIEEDPFGCLYRVKSDNGCIESFWSSRFKIAPNTLNKNTKTI